MIRCSRCRQKIDKDSAFAVLLEASSEGVSYEIVRSRNLGPTDLAVHVNGDPRCGKTVSSFCSELIQKLNLPRDFDLSFLESL